MKIVFSHPSASFLLAAAMLLLAASPAIIVQAQNPDDCSASGEDRFVCLVANQLTLGDSTTTISSTINCLLEPNVGMNFLEAQDCMCQATLVAASDSSTSRICNCGVCPTGTISLDCSGVPDNPYIFGQCSSMNCAGQCGDEDGGGGIPTTPAPAPTSGTDSGTDEPSTATVHSETSQSACVMVLAGLATLLLG